MLLVRLLVLKSGDASVVPLLLEEGGGGGPLGWRFMRVCDVLTTDIPAAMVTLDRTHSRIPLPPLIITARACAVPHGARMSTVADETVCPKSSRHLGSCSFTSHHLTVKVVHRRAYEYTLPGWSRTWRESSPSRFLQSQHISELASASAWMTPGSAPIVAARPDCYNVSILHCV